MPPVILSQETHQRIAAFARATGKTIASAADEALNEWMEINGEPVLKALKRKRDAKRKSCRAESAGRLLFFRQTR